MSLYFAFRVTRCAVTGRFHETRFGGMMRNLESAKKRARSINGLIRDDKNQIVAQAYAPSFPLFCGETK